MKSLLVILVTISVLAIQFISCNQPSEDIVEVKNPMYFEVKGYVVPKDRLSPPEIIQVDTNTLRKFPFKKPKAIPVDPKIRPAGQPKVIKPGKPKVITPGKDGYALPEIVPVIDKPFLAPAPLVIEARDPASKDINPNNFIIYTKKEGLIDNNIRALIEDHNGNLWFSNSRFGVTRFDGKFFTHYTKESGLSSNIILCILEDSRGNIWFGTNGAGVTKYDGRFFTHYTEKEGLVSNSIYSMIEDRKRNIWFGSWAGGFSIYNGNSFTNFSDKQGVGKSGVAMLEDSQGNFWIDIEHGGLVKYDGKSFSKFTVKEGLSGNDIDDFIEDSKHNVWFNSGGVGVTKYDGKHFSHFSIEEGLSGYLIRAILEDSEGNIWFGTQGDGITMYDGHHFRYFGLESGLPSDRIRSLLQDQSGNIWIGTDGGLAKYSGNTFLHFTKQDGLPSDQVSTILKDSAGNRWFGTSDGLALYEANSFIQIPIFEDMPTTYVRTMIEDRNQNLWISLAEEGLAKYDGKKFSLLTREQGLEVHGTQSLFVDRDNSLWIGTNGGGLYNYDGTSFKQYLQGVSGLSDNGILSILEDNKSRLWIGTYGGGITVREGERFSHYKIANGFISDHIGCFYEDEHGNMWIGTLGEGLCMCTLESEKYLLSCIHITEANGLSNNSVHSIIEDNEQNIVIGTKNGISIITKDEISRLTEIHTSRYESDIDNIASNLTYWEGFLGVGVNFGRPMCLEDDGTIWIGANDRLTLFNPHKYHQGSDTMGPNIKLMGVELFNENINWSNFAKNKNYKQVLENGVHVKHASFDSLSKWYPVPENLNLRHDNNYLTFKYIGITLHRPQKVKYQYILEGNDNDWSALTSNTEAHYGNLSHGSYTFKVKAMGSTGLWSDEVQYLFTIRPPWWLTWWAYSFYALGMITLLWRLHKFQQARTIRIERERTQAKELEQAKEIEKAYTQLETAHENLKSTQAQLIQSEKMASLGQVTAGIAHEIQNPLNFINNFSDVNKELLVEMKEELGKGNNNEATDIANDVIANEEKINHHGKRADAIVKGMLQHSRSSSGVKEPTDINALCDEYLRLAYHGLRAKDKSFNATMKTDFDEALGMVNVIPQDIGRVILNLINNAFYAVTEKQKMLSQTLSPHQTPYPLTGGDEYIPTVLVKTKKLLPLSGGRGSAVTKGFLEITVSDNGPGIPPSALDKIFQPFFTTKPTGQGTGLGLSLSYDIVKAHGGELKVETKEGEGSVFILQLPT
jgi:ligand-binding sensor domain-containing protein/signal transduction histidine kinase